MALNIKDELTDRLARQLARETGESITVATQIALSERLARVRSSRTTAASREQLTRLVERGRARPVLDDRAIDEIIGTTTMACRPEQMVIDTSA